MGTRSTSTAFLLAPRHFKFFGWKAGDSWLSKAIPSLQEVFTRQVLNVDYEIDLPEEIRQATRRYLKENPCAMECEEKYVWQAPWGFSAVRILPHQIVLILSQYFDITKLCFHRSICHALCGDKNGCVSSTPLM